MRRLYSLYAVQQILTKRPRLYLPRQIVVRGADQRKIDRISAAAAERRDRFFLQHPQQPRLQARRHVADFIEEQHAAVRLADLADIAFRVGAGKRPGA